MYRIQGSDRKEYGPISAEQIRQWVAENRLNRDSLAASDADPTWRPLAQFPEFASLFAAGPSAAPGIISMPGAAPDDPASREKARRSLQGPAIALIIIGLIGCVLAILGPFFKRTFVDFYSSMITSMNIPLDPNIRQALDAAKQEPVGVFDIVRAGASMALNALIVLGAIRMRQLRSYGLAMTSAILSVIPCCTCCCLGVPFGIWALVLLNRAEVKRAFQKS